MLLINNTSKQYNYGCKETSLCLLNVIKECDIEILDTIFLQDINKLIFDNELTLDTFSDLNSNDNVIFSTFNKRIQTSNCICINGEGSLYDGAVKGMILLYLAYIAKVVFKKKTIFINFTMDITNELMINNILKIFPLLDLVSFREEYSLSQYKNHCKLNFIDIGENIKYIPDVAFKNRNDLKVESDDYILLSASSRHMRDDLCEFHDPSEFYVELYNELSKDFNVKIAFHDRLEQRIFKDIDIENEDISLEDFNKLVVNSKLYFSGRWHSSIIALSNNVPCILMEGNSHKMLSLHKDFNFENFYSILSYNECDVKKCITLIKRTLNNTEIRSRIHEVYKRKIEESKKLITEIKEVYYE